MWIWDRVRRVDGGVLFSPYGVISARVRALRYVPMLDGSASDATVSASMCPLNLYARFSIYIPIYSPMRSRGFALDLIYIDS